MAFPAVNIAASVGIFGSTWITGGNMALSALAVPAILAAGVPGQAQSIQWKYVYENGMATMPKVAAAAFVGYAYAAYERHSRGQSWSSFAAAALFAIGIVPYTLVFMRPTNSTLIGVAEGNIKSLGDEGTRLLLHKWGNLNFARSLLTFASSLIGFWGLLA